jgi:CheY-like chemotaxis protein
MRTLPQILLVEADEVDAEYLKRQCKAHQLAHPITHVPDSATALATLRGEAPYPRLARPYLIVLELVLPGMSGIEFLHVLRQDDELKASIVFVLTTSERDEDKMAAYAKNVAAYLLKRHIQQNFSAFANLLRLYQMMELPL